MADHECIDCIAAGPLATYRPRRVVTAADQPKRCASHQQLHVKQTRKRARARSIERTYGISAEDAHELFLLQLGRCWLCQRATGATKSLAVDHDHQTGEVRGRLCGPCNQFIGRLGDDPEAAKRLVGYLTGDTPYRRLKARQTIAAGCAPGAAEAIRVFRVWGLGDEIFADWRFEGQESFSQTLVRRADGVWSTQRSNFPAHPNPIVALSVADSEPRVETPGECGSCHALPDQPHTEYCQLRNEILATASGQIFPSPPTHIADHPVR